MKPHIQYLRYVVLHKLYVLRAGLAIAKHVGRPQSRIAWLWRLLVHDLSKFSRAEWSPYVTNFYGARSKFADNEPGARQEARERHLAFQRAWLHHIHANDHHWQHHVLLEDSGKTIVLIPPAVLVYEMVADWLAAGPKALRAHSMAEAVAETIVWYAANHRQMQMRDLVRGTAESILHTLAEVYGVKNAAQDIESAQRARASIVIPGR